MGALKVPDMKMQNHLVGHEIARHIIKINYIQCSAQFFFRRNIRTQTKRANTVICVVDSHNDFGSCDQLNLLKQMPMLNYRQRIML